MPFAIWISLVLVGPAVSGLNLSLLWAWKSVSAPLGDQLSSGTEGCDSVQPLSLDVGLEVPCPRCSATPVFPELLVVPSCTVTGEKMVVSLSYPGVKAFPGDLFSPGRIGVQMAVEQPSSWV